MAGVVVVRTPKEDAHALETEPKRALFTSFEFPVRPLVGSRVGQMLTALHCLIVFFHDCSLHAPLGCSDRPLYSPGLCPGKELKANPEVVVTKRGARLPVRWE